MSDVWAALDEGCNAACHSASWAACAERYFDMFGFQSEYREGTRSKVFTGLGGNTVAAVGRRKYPFALAFTAERGDIHHLSGTIESWELPGDGPFPFSRSMRQAKVRSDQGYGKEPYLYRKTSLVSTSECTKMPRRD